MSGPHIHRPRGYVRTAVQAFTPIAREALKVSAARQLDQRRERLIAAARDRVAQRRTPTRPTMRALQLSPGARLKWVSAPAPPPPGPDGAVVHPIATATCDLDRAIALGRTPFAMPLHFGHECVAEVVQVGERVTTVKPGDRVVVPFQINCGHCARCHAGLTANCETVPPISMYGFGLAGGHWGGVVSDLVGVPFAEAMLVALPDGIDPAEAASVADNVSDAYRHVAPYLPAILARDPDAEVVLVAGQSERGYFSASVPMYAGLIARALGARHVTLADARPSVREQADKLGIAAIHPRELRRHPAAALVVESSAMPAGLKRALSVTGEDGVCSCAGSLHTSVAIPTGLMYARNMSLHIARSNARAIIPQVLDLMSAGKLRPGRVTTTLGRIDDAPRVLREHVLGDDTKTILVEGA